MARPDEAVSKDHLIVILSLPKYCNQINRLRQSQADIFFETASVQ